MRTCGLRERSIPPCGQLAGVGERQREMKRERSVGRGGITWGEMLDIDEGGIEAANHLVMYAVLQ